MLDKPSSHYGAGFRSLTAETPNPVALPVTGTLPSWLNGTLLRTGPSMFEVGERTYNHWFDGLAMLHRFAFGAGRVTYANCFLKSKAFCAAAETGKITYAEFATDPCRTLFGRVAAIFDPKLTDNCCVNVADYARQAVAFTETAMPMRFSPETLETLGVFNYRRALKGQVSTAHAHYDAKRACHYNYIADFSLKSLYRLCQIGDDGKQKVIATLPVERPAYMHSFGMSEDHLVLSSRTIAGSRSADSFFTSLRRTRGAWCARPRPTPPSPFITSTPSPMAIVWRSTSSPIPTPPSSISSILHGSVPALPSPRSERSPDFTCR